MQTMTIDSTKTSFFQFAPNSISGEPVDLEQFRGKKIIVMNVASKCGFTPQYDDWQKFYEANKEFVVVLGFPSNEFAGQEPGTEADIAAFCKKKFGVTFPMFEKSKVRGKDKSPLYQWLSDPEQNGWNAQAPTWNFCKYIIDENGDLTHFFPAKITPDNIDFLKAMGL
jgi:glutathione peroxidase